MKILIRNLYARAVMTSMIVGPVLTLINQYDAVIGHGRLNVMKMALTFVVPFVVSTSSSLLTKALDK